MNPELQAKIEEFLKERRESDGGYAPVTKEDWQLLHEVTSLLVDAKWGNDPDGDKPVNWRFVNRTEQEAFHYRPVLHSHDVEPTSYEFGEIVSDHMCNLSIAMRRFQSCYEDQQRALRRQKVEEEAWQAKKETLDQPVENLGLSIRTLTLLHGASCRTVEDVSKHSAGNLREEHGLGDMALKEIRQALGKVDLHLEGEG